MEVINKENIITSNLEDVMHNAMLPYAEYVILDRALPRVEDGLKPVQRRILYTMYENGIFPDKSYKKSARVVGDCLGKYHPHGDSSVYDAMVRLAQPFNMRMTLVDGQGNFGSIDGDPAAAMRYTEVKMRPLAMELIKDIEKDTVRWNPNFDDSLKEPDLLPSKFPNILVNGAAGIAVGLATNIPTHNLGEVIDGAIAYIENPKISLSDLMKIVPGPDFPTGGYIISNGELENAYKTGKGKIYIRAKLSLENGDGDKQSIVITELPYGVNKAKLLARIDALTEEKKDIFAGIQSINDESDRNGMRAVIKLKKDADVKKIINGLLKYSDLQISYSINIVAIAGGKPMQLGLKEIYSYYVEHQRNVVLRRTKFDLERAKERAHILEGLIVAVTNIDEVIKIIRSSPDTPSARQSLRKRFSLTERQAQAILDLRLSRLTKLEIHNLKAELEQLKRLIAEYESIIASKARQLTVVKKEMLDIKKRFADERRTQIKETEDMIDITAGKERKIIENYVVGFSESGRVRKISPNTYRRITDDSEPIPRDIFRTAVRVTSEDTVLAFTNIGNCFKMDVELLAESKNSMIEGVKFGALFKDAEKNEYPVSMIAVKTGEEPKGKLVFFTKCGMIKLTALSEYVLQKSFYAAMKLKDGDEVLSVEYYAEDKDLFFVSAFGMTLRCKNEIPEQGRVSGGVKGMELDGKDKVVFATQIGEKTFALLGATNGNFKKVSLDEISTISRARKGVKIFDLGDGKFGEEILAATIVDGKVTIFIKDRINAEYYSTDAYADKESRTAKGKTLKNVGSCQPAEIYFSKKMSD